MNFKINIDLFKKLVLKRIIEEKENYGKNKNGLGKTVIVDFSSPNVAKPFHAGHLRSTMIGGFVKNLLIANGYNTLGINHLGDWGKQYGNLYFSF